MKTIFAALALTIVSAPAFAGTAITYNNDALEFSLILSSMSDEADICDADNNCLTLAPVKSLSSTKTLYREASGKCEVVIEDFEKNFAEGTTKNDFMLSLSAKIVKVVKGEDSCMLQQKLPKQKRSVTGAYLL